MLCGNFFYSQECFGGKMYLIPSLFGLVKLNFMCEFTGEKIQGRNNFFSKEFEIRNMRSNDIL